MDPTGGKGSWECHPERVPSTATDAKALHRERLTPPWWGWLLAAFWASTLGIAYGYAISTVVGVLVWVLLFSIAAAALVRMSAVVEVSPTGLRAGRASLPASAIGEVTALEAAEARHLRGTGADSRAFVVLRGWVRGAVRVEVDDAADPTPYWFVSTRHPDTLAKALQSVRDRP